MVGCDVTKKRSPKPSEGPLIKSGEFLLALAQLANSGGAAFFAGSAIRQTVGDQIDDRKVDLLRALEIAAFALRVVTMKSVSKSERETLRKMHAGLPSKTQARAHVVRLVDVVVATPARDRPPLIAALCSALPAIDRRFGDLDLLWVASQFEKAAPNVGASRIAATLAKKVNAFDESAQSIVAVTARFDSATRK